MSLAVDLLGSPRVVRDGEGPVSLRGRKVWGLLAALLLAERPLPRERLAQLLFADADDPLGALRWSLSELRRVLGPGTDISGDPVVVRLQPTAVVDVEILRRGLWFEAVDLPGLGRELLEGVPVAGSAAFEIWLAGERRRLAGIAGAVLHEATLRCAAGGDAAGALAYASRLVELHPLDEANHVLLVQCLRRAGDLDGAAEAVERCVRVWRRDLGCDPGPAVRDALHAPVVRASGEAIGSVPAMLEAAEAAIAAGGVAQGLQTLAEATALARRDDDRALLARSLFVRGHALVQVGRCGDDEGCAALHEAAALAVDVDPLLAASAYRELAFADLERGRYDHARALAATAAGLADGDDAELAWIEGVSGACLSDQARYPEAIATLGSAVNRAERAGVREAFVFAGSFLGRVHLLRGDLDEAAEVLANAAREARATWLALLPWPEALLAETELRRGDVDAATARFERAFALGRQLDDPCLEAIAARGLGLVAVTRGQVAKGYGLLVDAPRMARRLPDSYLWIEAYGLDALCRVGMVHRADVVGRWIAALEAVAARCGMRELVARATLYRARLGEPGALDVARDLAERIDNPALHADLALVG